MWHWCDVCQHGLRWHGVEGGLCRLRCPCVEAEGDESTRSGSGWRGMCPVGAWWSGGLNYGCMFVFECVPPLLSTYCSGSGCPSVRVRHCDCVVVSVVKKSFWELWTVLTFSPGQLPFHCTTFTNCAIADHSSSTLFFARNIPPRRRPRHRLTHRGQLPTPT